jgi:pyrimidine 5'-nucleotidase
MKYTTLFFDLDDTLYPNENGLWDAIRERMSLFMAEKVGIPWDQIPELRKEYYQTYGTTLRGLQIHYHVDPNEYLAYVHDLPLEKFIEPIPGLREMLLSLPQQRWIFTNSDSDHAHRVLKYLDLEGCFEGIIDIRETDFACKPELIAYQRAQTIAGEPDPHKCVMFDDSPQNLEPAHQLGFATILVGSNYQPTEAVDYHILDLLSLPRKVPVLWATD